MSEKEAVQLLRDPTIEPTGEVIAGALGGANDAYARFVEDLESHGVEVTWRFYSDGMAWLGKALHKWTTSRGTNKEATVFWLSIWEGFFKLAFYLPTRVRLDMLDLPLSDEVMDMAQEAEQMGKINIFPMVFEVRTDEQFEDIYTLVDFKKSLK